MDKEKIKQEITLLLEIISEQYSQSSSHQGKIPQIEIDMMMENVRKLYEQLHRLNKINDEVSTMNFVQPVPEQKEKLPEIFEEIKTEEKAEVKITQEETVTTNSKKTTTTLRASATLFADFETLSDQFEEATTFNDNMVKTKEEKTLVDKLNLTPIQDLKKAIGINEKFNFINELFDGDLKNYNESIDTLNSFTNFEEASDYLKTLSTQYNWSDTKAFNNLSALVKRRYLS